MQKQQAPGWEASSQGSCLLARIKRKHYMPRNTSERPLGPHANCNQLHSMVCKHTSDCCQHCSQLGRAWATRIRHWPYWTQWWTRVHAFPWLLGSSPSSLRSAFMLWPLLKAQPVFPGIKHNLKLHPYHLQSCLLDITDTSSVLTELDTCWIFTHKPKNT